MTISMLLATSATILRIVFFKKFLYTGYAWFEPLLVGLAIIIFLTGNFVQPAGWMNWTFPIPHLFFAFLIARGIVKDKKQLSVHAVKGYKVAINSAAPDFELTDQDGEKTKLSTFRNKRHMLLIFVRGDWCPGCHMMLRTYQKNSHLFKEKNVYVLAIGPDPVGVNREMVTKLNLDFKVLADEKQRTAMKYGVQLEEYDNEFAESYDEGIPLPASFLVDKSGVVRYISRPDKVGEFLNPMMIFSVLDKIEQRPVEVAIQQSEIKLVSHYETIVEQANDAILVIDIVDGRIHQANAEAARMLGYTEEELTKKNLFNLYAPELLEYSSRIVADAWEKKGLIWDDIPFVKKDGNKIPVECSAKVTAFKARPSIIIYARDITERLRMQNEILEQKKIIEKKNKDITDSINYAKGIQKAIFPRETEFRKLYPESFILFRPKDIVSGDFYWFRKKNNKILLATADCTGHGVPGAMMSMIGSSMLNEIVSGPEDISPAKVLMRLREKIVQTFVGNQGRSDGMDITFCQIDKAKMELQYAGALNPIWIARDEQITVTECDRFPVANQEDAMSKEFTNHTIELKAGDAIYTFTDGYADQFGGKNKTKFKPKLLRALVLSMQHETMEEQKNILGQTLDEWKGDTEQIDDITMIGIRI